MSFLKNKIFWFAAAIIAIVAIVIVFNSVSSSQTLWNLAKSGKWFGAILVIAALVDSLNPCAISVLLLTIAFLFSMGSMRRKVVHVGGFYIFGIFATYVFIGLGILQALQFLNVPHVMAKIGASILMAFGVVELLGEIFQSFPIKLKIPERAHSSMAVLMEKASLPTAFILGVLVGLYEFPCTGGPYLLVLGMLHDRAEFWSGFGYLILYNLIFVLPLSVILGVASDRALLERATEWKKQNTSRARWIMGVAMILLGLIIFMF